MARKAPNVTDPNVLASLACLGGFWWFLHRATDAAGRETPRYLRWVTWW